MMKLKYSICCGLDVHKKFIIATIVSADKDKISKYNKNLFQPSARISKGFTTGSSGIIAIMFAWNPLVSLEFLFLIISKTTSMSASHIPNMSKPSKARKRTKRIPNRSQTSINLTLSDVLLFLRRISDSSGNLPDTASNWSA